MAARESISQAAGSSKPLSVKLILISNTDHWNTSLDHPYQILYPKQLFQARSWTSSWSSTILVHVVGQHWLTPSLVEEDTQSWGRTWHKFIPNPITISIGMALEGGGHVPLVPPCFRHLCPLNLRRWRYWASSSCSHIWNRCQEVLSQGWYTLGEVCTG